MKGVSKDSLGIIVSEPISKIAYVISVVILQEGERRQHIFSEGHIAIMSVGVFATSEIWRYEHNRIKREKDMERAVKIIPKLCNIQND